jgi:hypothetical protein
MSSPFKMQEPLRKDALGCGCLRSQEVDYALSWHAILLNTTISYCCEDGAIDVLCERSLTVINRRNLQDRLQVRSAIAV